MRGEGCNYSLMFMLTFQCFVPYIWCIMSITVVLTELSNTLRGKGLSDDSVAREMTWEKCVKLWLGCGVKRMATAEC